MERPKVEVQYEMHTGSENMVYKVHNIYSQNIHKLQFLINLLIIGTIYSFFRQSYTHAHCLITVHSKGPTDLFPSAIKVHIAL